jgi:hypothetical protein
MTTYHGSCHCGRVRFQIDAEVERVVQCNCSLCGKTGWLLLQVPAAQFHLLAGADALVRYQFNTHFIAHQHCATCGIHPFSHPDGEVNLYMVNVRCLDDFDLAAHPPEIQHYDGRAR